MGSKISSAFVNLFLKIEVNLILLNQILQWQKKKESYKNISLVFIVSLENIRVRGYRPSF